MRWTITLSTLALVLAATAGCKQQCFLTEPEYHHYRDKLAGDLEFQPDASQQLATSIVHNAAEPRTVLAPDAKQRFISLAESISISLEQGTRGPGLGTGTGDDTLVRFQAFGGPGGALFSDNIRVLALNPAVSGTNIDSALSKFDATFSTAMTWNVTDRPIGTALDAFQAGRSGALNSIMTDGAQFSSQLVKPLPTGGTAGITFNTQYQFTNLPARINPAYTPSLQFAFEQPLLQGFGIEINQLRATHPGSQLLQGALAQAGGLVSAAGGAAEGILITRIRFDQERADFEASVNQMVLNVEVAYWNLYSSYWTLYSRELGLRLSYEFFRIINARYLAGGAQTTRLQDVARARGQYELFRGQRLEALGRVLENERQLRKLLGMPAEDGCRLVPSDVPTKSPYKPDYKMALEDALKLRPELVIARENLKVRQLELINQKNLLLPDLRVFATYDINSIGTQLDGGTPNNAFRNLAENDFHNWQIGARLTVPLGFRQAHASVRRSRLELARSYALLKDQELKAEQFLVQQYRRLDETYEQIKAQQAQREAYGQQLRLEYERVRVGQVTVADSTALLEAQRFYSEALAREYDTIALYNNTLATFEFAKGTLLHHNNIVISEGPLPNCVQERAVEHYNRRNHALVVAERTRPVHCSEGCDNGGFQWPVLPKDQAATLPALMEKAPHLPEGSTPEMMPTPRETPLPGQPVPSMPSLKMGASAAPARQEPFGTARMLPGSPLNRDSTPSLMPEFTGSPQR